MTFQFSIDVPSSQPLSALRLCRFCFQKKLQTHKRSLLNGGSFHSRYSRKENLRYCFAFSSEFLCDILNRDFENCILRTLSSYRNHGIILSIMNFRKYARISWLLVYEKFIRIFYLKEKVIGILSISRSWSFFLLPNIMFSFSLKYLFEILQSSIRLFLNIFFFIYNYSNSSSSKSN